jgi:hypothetical protein
MICESFDPALLTHSPQSFSADYSRVMRHRIRTKTEEFRSQIALLQGCGALGDNRLSVTENCNGVTEYCNVKKSSNQADLSKRAPRMGFEPMRNGCSTGSQGPRVNHSATSARQFNTSNSLLLKMFTEPIPELSYFYRQK